jgi:hypothetical protein
MPEITRDENGSVYLLADELYTNRSYNFNAKAFDEEIRRYAAAIGIDREHIRFNGEVDKGPNPLKTGDEVYRDSWKEDVDPAMLPPQKALSESPK